MFTANSSPNHPRVDRLINQAALQRFALLTTLCFVGFLHPLWAQSEEEENSANVEVTCNGIVVHFSGIPSWTTNYWDFGDGSDILSGGPELVTVDHEYHDINPFSTTITAHHSLDGTVWLDEPITFPGIFVGSGCGSTRLLSTLVSGGVLPASELSDKTLYLFGDLEVDIPYTFSGCTLNIITGGRIIVKSGGKLILSNGTVATNIFVSGSCNYLWNGIEVRTGGQLVTDDATIQNAYFAIRPILQQKGQVPILNLNNTTFSGDFIGIYAAGGAFNVAKFSANTFEGSGNTAILNVGACNTPGSISGIPFAQRTYAGIFFDGTSGGEMTLPAGATANQFEDLQAGIVALNGNVKIAGCQFEHIASITSNSALYQGTAITFIDNLGAHELTVDGLGKDGDFTVYNCKRGIYAATSQGHTRATITNCRMEQIQNGILLDESLPGNFIEAVIEDNYIESSIYVGAMFERATAVEVRDPSSWHSTISIQRNEI